MVVFYFPNCDHVGVLTGSLKEYSALLSRFFSMFKGNDRLLLLRIMAFMNGLKGKSEFVEALLCVRVCVFML